MNQNQRNGVTSRGLRDITIDMRGVCGELAVCKKKNVKDCDAFILVHDASPVFTLLGWAKSEELLSESNIKDTGYGPNYNMDSTSLTTMDFFEPYIEWKSNAKSI
jgi:hypothetical protein